MVAYVFFLYLKLNVIFATNRPLYVGSRNHRLDVNLKRIAGGPESMHEINHFMPCCAVCGYAGYGALTSVDDSEMMCASCLNNHLDLLRAEVELQCMQAGFN